MPEPRPVGREGTASRIVRAGGVQWHVQQAGAGPALLLVHGTGASIHTWRGVIPVLSRHHAVTAVDLPGHGLTDSVAGAGCSIEGMSSGLAALLTELKAQPSYCVGHSAGAVVLCRMALDRLIAPRLIVSVNGAFMPLSGVAGMVFSPLARALSRSPTLSHALAWASGTPANVRRLIEGTGSQLDAEGIEHYARLVRDPRHVAGALAMMGHWDLEQFSRDLPALATPLALLIGANDRTVPPGQASWVKRRVVFAEIHRLEGLGHLAHEEQPGLVARKILEICERASSPDPSAPGDASVDRCDPRIVR